MSGLQICSLDKYHSFRYSRKTGSERVPKGPPRNPCSPLHIYGASNVSASPSLRESVLLNCNQTRGLLSALCVRSVHPCVCLSSCIDMTFDQMPRLSNFVGIHFQSCIPVFLGHFTPQLDLTFSAVNYIHVSRSHSESVIRTSSWIFDTVCPKEELSCCSPSLHRKLVRGGSKWSLLRANAETIEIGSPMGRQGTRKFIEG